MSSKGGGATGATGGTGGSSNLGIVVSSAKKSNLSCYRNQLDLWSRFMTFRASFHVYVGVGHGLSHIDLSTKGGD